MNPKTFEIAFLKAMNAAKKGDKAGHCKVGRAEIEKETLLGSLLKEG